MLPFISPYAIEILGVVTEKVTAKALWEVIGTFRNQFRYQLVLIIPTAREVHATIKKRKGKRSGYNKYLDNCHFVN